MSHEALDHHDEVARNSLHRRSLRDEMRCGGTSLIRRAGRTCVLLRCWPRGHPGRNACWFLDLSSESLFSVGRNDVIDGYLWTRG